MILETLGHASLLLSDDDGLPLLLTDPWLLGSTYWRSWWLQNYPTARVLDRLRDTRFIYITHEHPDHYHPPSLRRLGPGPEILLPRFPETRMADHLRQNGRRVTELPPFDLVDLGNDIRIASCPVWNDDSILLVDTPHATLVNLNDVKPFGRLYPKIRDFLDRDAKPVVLLCSHSAASIVNSFTRSGVPDPMMDKESFIRLAERACELLGADFYIPFASQVVYSRSDSQWANPFRVLYPDLEREWNSPTRLLPPFTRLDLATFEHTSTPTEAYDDAQALKAPKIAAQESLDAETRIDPGDLEKFAAQLGTFRWLFTLLFPAGIGFDTGLQSFHYQPFYRRIRASQAPGAFRIDVPAAPFKEAIEHDRLSDLGIAMFARISMCDAEDKRLVYLFFTLMELRENGHFRGLAGFARWVRYAIDVTFFGGKIGRKCRPFESLARVEPVIG
jgi:hypothetical protein